MGRASLISRRLAVAAHDAAGAAVVAALLSCGFAAPAYAYVDPSVMTYTIQALAGVAVALSAVAGVAFRRTRKALLKALHIDENAHKTVEPDVHRVKDGVVIGVVERSSDDEAVPAPDTSSSASRLRLLSWPQRLAISFAIVVFAVFTLFVVAPFELVAGNSASLIFGIGAVWQPIVLSALAITVVLAFGLSALRGRAFAIAALIVFGFGLGCYVQAMFMNGGLPAGDGRQVDWGNYVTETVVSSIVWIVLLAIPLAFAHWHGRTTLSVSAILSVMLVIVQGVGVASLMAGVNNAEVSAEDYAMTEEGMLTVSPDSNVIVFVLDTYDTVDLMNALEVDPTMLDEMTGFTWFKNSVGSMDPTRYGAVFLHTGVYPEPGEDLLDFVKERYERSTYLGDIFDAGYSIGIYTDTLGDYLMPDRERIDLIYDKTINIHLPADGDQVLDVGGMLVEMAKCSLYRDLPWIAKAPFWFTTDEVNKAMAVKATAGPAPYIMDDADWFSKLKNIHLSFDERTDAVGAYRFIHLIGTHVPYSIDAEGYFVGTWESDAISQARGTMHMVSEYLRQLKEIGAYDNSTIIITADHGEWFDKDYRTDWDIPTSPILLVKPAHASDAPVVDSSAEVTAYDILPTVIDAVGGDSSAYGPTVFEQPDSGRDRRYLHTYCYGNTDLEITEYQIVGDVLDENNWVTTGVTWDPSNVPFSD